MSMVLEKILEFTNWVWGYPYLSEGTGFRALGLIYSVVLCIVIGLPGNKSFCSDRFTLVFQSLKMMYDYKLNLVVRTPWACPWE